jgi:hypothetical protein
MARICGPFFCRELQDKRSLAAQTLEIRSAIKRGAQL